MYHSATRAGVTNHTAPRRNPTPRNQSWRVSAPTPIAAKATATKARRTWYVQWIVAPTLDRFTA
jgi:hypothetical protein